MNNEARFSAILRERLIRIFVIKGSYLSLNKEILEKAPLRREGIPITELFIVGTGLRACPYKTIAHAPE